MSKNKHRSRHSLSLRSAIIVSLPIIVAILISFILQLSVVSNPEKFASWLSSFGPFLFIIYALIQIASIVIAPIGGTFIQYALIALIGPLKALSLIYLIATPTYVVNFFLARRYGRPLVKKVVGEKGLAKIDHYAKDAGVSMLIILKVLQGGYFDYISYAAGLTTISFHDFILINIFGGIPGTILAYVIFSKAPNFFSSVILLQIVAAILIALSLFLTYRHKQRKV